MGPETGMGDTGDSEGKTNCCPLSMIETKFEKANFPQKLTTKQPEGQGQSSAALATTQSRQ